MSISAGAGAALDWFCHNIDYKTKVFWPFLHTAFITCWKPIPCDVHMVEVSPNANSEWRLGRTKCSKMEEGLNTEVGECMNGEEGKEKRTVIAVKGSVASAQLSFFSAFFSPAFSL